MGKLRNQIAAKVRSGVESGINVIKENSLSSVAAASGATSAATHVKQIHNEDQRERTDVRYGLLEKIDKNQFEKEKELSTQRFLEHSGGLNEKPAILEDTLKKANLIEDHMEVVNTHQGVSLFIGSLPLIVNKKLEIRKLRKEISSEEKRIDPKKQSFQESQIKPPDNLFASVSINGLYKGILHSKNVGVFAAINKEKENLIEGKPEAKILYSAPVSPTLESLYVFYLVKGAALLIILPPFTRKGQNFIRSLLGLKETSTTNPAGQGISLTSKEKLEYAMQVVEKYNEKKLTLVEAHIFLSQSYLFTNGQISILLGESLNETDSFFNENVNS